jgi:hypothetical protein
MVVGGADVILSGLSVACTRYLVSNHLFQHAPRVLLWPVVKRVAEYLSAGGRAASCGVADGLSLLLLAVSTAHCQSHLLTLVLVSLFVG